MSFSIRTLAFATFLIAAVFSWTALSAYVWVWTLLVFLALAIFLASLEVDHVGSS